MEKSVTTSVRLPKQLKRQIDRKAATDGCGRNRVIIAALERYLQEDQQAAYSNEAARQSKLAAKLDVVDPSWDKLVEGDFPTS